MQLARTLVLALVAAALVPVAGRGADQPIAGRKLVIGRAASGAERLVFVSKDPAFLFPAIGGPDDPATGSPGGAQLDLVTERGGSATLVAPSGAGTPGWRTKRGRVDVYKFVDPPGGVLSDLRVVVLKDSKVLKVVAKSTGLPLDGPLGAVGVRLTTGNLRSCARFDPGTIRRDVAGRYVAKHAAAGALTDCSDASLAGAAPCGSVSGFPTCNGACPTGQTCGAFSSPSPALGNYCACGGCGDGASCPLGFTCADLGGGSLTCVPIFCSGGDPYPTCGGTCAAGLACGAVQLSDAAFAGCLCGPPLPCDAACGGWLCDPGQVCVADTGLSTCGCQ